MGDQDCRTSVALYGRSFFMAICLQRLAEERKQWRKDHRISSFLTKAIGFVAKPSKDLDTNSINLLKWDCKIPGKANTMWEGGLYSLVLKFPQDYPIRVSYLRNLSRHYVFSRHRSSTLTYIQMAKYVFQY